MVGYGERQPSANTTTDREELGQIAAELRCIAPHLLQEPDITRWTLSQDQKMSFTQRYTARVSSSILGIVLGS